MAILHILLLVSSVHVILADLDSDYTADVFNIDCETFSKNAPPKSPWKPKCDPKTNHLTPLQSNNDGTNFCVDPRMGTVLLKASQKVTNCECIAASAAGMTDLRTRKMSYTPQCDMETGAYLSKQCNSKGSCWCVTATGMQLGPKYGPRVKNALLRSLDAEIGMNKQPRADCGLINKYWKQNNE